MHRIQVTVDTDSNVAHDHIRYYHSHYATTTTHMHEGAMRALWL